MGKVASRPIFNPLTFEQDSNYATYQAEFSKKLPISGKEFESDCLLRYSEHNSNAAVFKRFKATYGSEFGSYDLWVKEVYLPFLQANFRDFIHDFEKTIVLHQYWDQHKAIFRNYDAGRTHNQHYFENQAMSQAEANFEAKFKARDGVFNNPDFYEQWFDQRYKPKLLEKYQEQADFEQDQNAFKPWQTINLSRYYRAFFVHSRSNSQPLKRQARRSR